LTTPNALLLSLSRSRGVSLSLACVITLYAGLLRLDAFVDIYGPLDHPAWARIATRTIAPLAEPLHPAAMRWNRLSTPYVGGDPINYLLYARTMTTFYQPHVREPVFLAMTRAALWALDGQDAGVSLASAIGSMLAIFATYLLGAALVSPIAGLLAAALMAIEFEAISWAPEGWRDDTFMATVLFATWAMVRLRARPTFANAILTGVLIGLACLTRITAFVFVIPGLAWLVLDGPKAELTARLQRVGLAGFIGAAIVAPYLISCAIGTGDALLAINYHTGFYRFAEGQPITQSMSAAQYISAKFAAHPVATIDNALNGLFVQPFVMKWRGFEVWVPGMGRALEWLALAGLATWPFTAGGRLALVVLLSSLAPYIFTWNLRGGSEWRFTMHAYAFYLVAAATAIVGTAYTVRTIVRDRHVLRRSTVIRIGLRVATVVVVAVLGVATYFALPWYVVREAILLNESTSVQTGERDHVFYRSGWSSPHDEGVTVRVSQTERPVVRIPLPVKRDYDLVLRIDPVAPGTQDRVSVLFNRHILGHLRLGWDPSRVGTYRLHVPERMVRVGGNELLIISDQLVSASSAGPRFAWLDPTERVGVRLWYVRVLP
jgi:4-amino-4-deoxy-L-arabinose transferase-like glycosyltransferase